MSLIVIENSFLPEWDFIQFTTEHPFVNIGTGQYSLRSKDNPGLFISWVARPELEPFCSATDEEFESLSEEDWNSWGEWYQAFGLFDQELQCHPLVGFDLVQDAIEGGWDRSEEPRFTVWLFKKLAKSLERYERFQKEKQS